ncbi:MAG: hypothetical protein KKC68_03830 [Candidatus Thermoplasmatota archaeon]|nr:hypothetical protein [Candidatus Thermoplasmatota archaeon]
MKRMVLLVMSIFFVLVLLFAGCSGENKFVGTWRTKPLAGVSFGLTFSANGTLYIEGTSTSVGTWGVQDEKLIINAPDAVLSVKISGVFSYSFSEGDQVLTLSSSGISIIFEKK